MFASTVFVALQLKLTTVEPVRVLKSPSSALNRLKATTPPRLPSPSLSKGWDRIYMQGRIAGLHPFLARPHVTSGKASDTASGKRTQQAKLWRLHKEKCNPITLIDGRHTRWQLLKCTISFSSQNDEHVNNNDKNNNNSDDATKNDYRSNDSDRSDRNSRTRSLKRCMVRLCSLTQTSGATVHCMRPLAPSANPSKNKKMFCLAWPKWFALERINSSTPERRQNRARHKRGLQHMLVPFSCGERSAGLYLDSEW